MSSAEGPHPIIVPSSPILESGRPHIPDRRKDWSIRTLLFPNKESSDDVIEKLLNQSISEPTNDASFLWKLKQEYGRYKSRPALRYQGGFLRQALLAADIAFTGEPILSLWEFPPTGAIDRDSSRNNSVMQTEVLDNETFSEWACCASNSLEGGIPGNLQLVALADEPQTGDLKPPLPFWSYVITTFRGRLKISHLVPTWIMMFVIKQHWRIDLTPGSSMSNVAQEFSRPRPVPPPSMRTQHKVGAEGQGIRIWGESLIRPGNMDPTRGDNEILLTWQCEVPRYSSDLNIYIWEPHKTAPAGEHVRIVWCPAEDHRIAANRLLMAFRSFCSYAKFYSKREANSTLAYEAIRGTTEKSRNVSVNEVLLSLTFVFEMIAEDSFKFLRECHDEACRVNDVSRQNPTTSKMRYLMHLEDCRNLGHKGIKHGLIVLAALEGWVKSNPQNDSFPDAHSRFEKLNQDLTHLDSCFEQLGLYIQGNQDVLRRHFQLAQDLTLFRLTILAAIFLPLSFTTSFFGMNIDANTEEGPKGFSNWTNSTLEGLPLEMRNSTELLLSILGTSANLGYDWLTFGITSGCLLLTLPLSLTFGAMLRTLVVSVTKYSIYWRIPVVMAGLLYVILSVAGQSLGGYLARDSSLAFLVPYWISNGVLLLFELWTTYRAWAVKHRQFYWTVLLITTTLCFTFSNATDFPLMMIPWGLIMCRYISAWYLRRRRKGKRSG